MPPSERRDFAGTDAGRAEAERLFRKRGQLSKFPAALVDQVVGQVYDGPKTQLRGYPIGMRIDGWIEAELPALGAAQREAAVRQQRDNLAVLKPDVRGSPPKPNYAVNLAMNVFIAIHRDRTLGKAG